MLNKNVQEKLLQIRKAAEERMAQRNAAKLNSKYINLLKTPIGIEALALIPEEVAKKARILAIEKKHTRIAVAAVDAQDAETQKVIKDLEARGFITTIFAISQQGLDYGMAFYKYVAEKAEDITGKVAIEGKLVKEKTDLTSIENIKKVLDKEEYIGSNTGEILEIILKSALENRASDIHFEPSTTGTKLRFRIDGNLNDIYEINKKFYPNLLSRVKLLCKMKLNVTTEPQDGRFTINLEDKEVEVRVAVAPAQFGEVIVMRVLDPSAVDLNLKNLGLREDDLKIIETELKKPNGMILNTGPTGSGKTTTLYAFLQHKKTPAIKIITIEDPIEYRFDGIEQTQIDESTGYTFANGLRSLMRQDPDIILVGEIRDKETAEIGIQAALTGHLVFSTVHANSASGAIPRLLDLNVKPASIGPALNLVIGQRLVRKLCPECRIEKPADEALKTKIAQFMEKLPGRINKEDYKDVKIFQAHGCPACNNAGYRGRIAIYELLQFVPEMEKIILGQQGENAFREFAISHGMATLQQDGILKVLSGTTTFEEVENVTGPINL